MKLALGTVQFGLAYGAFNRNGQVTESETANILERAKAAGINLLDTAHAYGNSESVLGSLDAASRFRVVTKLPALNDDLANRATELFSESLRRLRVQRVYGLLLHRAADLLGPNADDIWKKLQDQRERGFVQRIGFSAYGPTEALEVLRRYPVELIQLPLNVFDTRHIDSGLLEICKSRGIEVHARSIFLQGFAIGNPAELVGHLAKYRDVLERFQARCRDLKLTPMQAALRFALDLPQVDQVVIGVESCKQLEEILTATRAEPLPTSAFKDLNSDDLALVDPSLWAAKA
ncbi:aldo/keto reductase [Stenotrophobium rhamnosiphilum]|uniref:NADP-dependent oxidoreductase domain-containing protein n=1 Tax=Stenotrophobium rhamnosiphilum TaxID=2029166 RepID=A0A2T5MIH8_9GAMM|nr:aldo/keto reductase [Stenotrophobium rhamnosiphilum]PTU32375.1 hypothetical protein CJD38_06920 [Stenotrophobium rhamnosiphilum]